MGALAAQAGLTPSQLLVMQILKERGETSAGDLAQFSQLKHATITSIVDKLVAKRMISRNRGAEDRRRVWVKLLPCGESAIGAAPNLLQDTFQSRFDRLPDWHQSMLVSALERVAALLDAEDMDAAPILDVGALDETEYADVIAKRFLTDHRMRKVGSEDFGLIDTLAHHFDEPFADSSSLPTFIVSNKTREYVKVALTGDGGDEMFGGYNKHYADWQIRQNRLSNKIVTSLSPLWKMLPKSRNGKFSNLLRRRSFQNEEAFTKSNIINPHETSTQSSSTK